MLIPIPKIGALTPRYSILFLNFTSITSKKNVAQGIRYILYKLGKAKTKDKCDIIHGFDRIWLCINSEILLLFIVSIRHQCLNVCNFRTAYVKTLKFDKKMDLYEFLKVPKTGVAS